MTAIFIVNAVIISILTPGRSRKTPNDKGTAVHSNTEGHCSTADANTDEVRWHLITHTNGTFSQSLYNWQLQAEYKNRLKCQQDKLRDEECTCKELKTGNLQYFLHSSLHTIKWKFINYSAQGLYVSVKNVMQSYTTNISSYLTRLSKCRTQC